MSLFVYETIPLDEGWDHLELAKDCIKRMETSSLTDNREKVERLKNDLSFSVEIAKCDLDFDGVFREEPRVFWIPENGIYLACGFVWKADDNGTTYVASPVPLNLSCVTGCYKS